MLNNSAKRNSSVEILRIIAMFFIVVSHFCVHGGFNTVKMDFSLNKNILQFGVLGNLGVIIFVMISGYFLSKSKFKIKNVIKVVLNVFFWSVAIFLSLAYFGIIKFSLKDLIRNLFPVIFYRYWFASNYVVFVLLSPFVNKLLNMLERKYFEYFIILLLVMWSVIPMIFGKMMCSNELCQFLIFYSIGAYVRAFPERHPSKKVLAGLTVCSALLMILSTVFINYLSVSHKLPLKGTFLYERNSIVAILLGYSIFMLFIKKKETHSRVINTISSCAFGVYLISDNPYLRKLIWHNLLHVNAYKDSPYLLLIMLFYAAAVFICCAAIQYIYQLTVEKVAFKLLDPIITHEKK